MNHPLTHRRGSSWQPRRHGGRKYVLAVLFSLLLGAIRPAHAQTATLGEGGPPFGVRSAYTQLVDGVYLLSARLYLPADDRLRALLKDGVALRLTLEIQVSRERGYWFDEELAFLTQRYQLRYHAVSDRYVLVNLNSGEQHTFPTLDDALAVLTRVDRLPLLDKALVDPRRQYEGRMRILVTIGEVPTALRWLMFWADKGRYESEWYVWRVLQ